MLWRIFFNSCDNWKTLFFLRVYGYWDFSIAPYCFLWNKFFERSSYFTFSPQWQFNTIKAPKYSHTFSILYLINFRSRLISWESFLHSYFLTTPHFSLKNFIYYYYFFFFSKKKKKIKTSLKAYFYVIEYI